MRPWAQIAIAVLVVSILMQPFASKDPEVAPEPTGRTASTRVEDLLPFAETQGTIAATTTAPASTVAPTVATTIPVAPAAVVTVQTTRVATNPPTTRATLPATTVAPAGGVAYENCSAARAAGAAPVYRDDPGYAPHLDRDNDGIGCEN